MTRAIRAAFATAYGIRVAIGLPLTLFTCAVLLVAGQLALAGELLVLNASYLLGVAAVGLWERSSTELKRFSPALVLLDVAGITGGLHLLGLHWSPAAAFYLPTLLFTGLVGRTRGAVVAGASTVACYAALAALMNVGTLEARSPAVVGGEAVPLTGLRVLAFTAMTLVLTAASAWTQIPVRASIRRPGLFTLSPRDGEHVGQMAHAIRNPLTALLGLVEMRAERAGASAEDQRVRDLSRRIARIVDGVLSLSRRGNLQLGAATARGILADVVTELGARCRERGVELHPRASRGLGELHVDRSLLVTALASIVENAVDAAPAGSSVELRARPGPESKTVEFAVFDRGPGMDPEVASRALEPFFSTKHAGTGLGLAIADAIVHAHRGSLAIESSSASGTRVVVSLPS